MAEPAIDVRGLTKAFDGRTVVDHIDLAVPRGEVCGFLGPNGSGKTTTIRMLCGLLEVDAGEGTCLGYDIRRDSRRIKLRVGFMTQRFGLYEDLSIAEDLDFTARVYRLGSRRRRVDTVEDVEEGASLLEQGVYELAFTARGIAEAGKPETLAQRILRLTPDARRRVFVVYVGDALRSGDGTQAWAAQGDLVLNPADAPRCENLIRSTLAERKRLYQPFLDARRRIETD